MVDINNQKELSNLEINKIKDRKERDQALFRNALMELGAATDGKQGDFMNQAMKLTGSETLLFRACYLICVSLRMNIGSEQLERREVFSSIDLSDIAQALHFRYRQVLLEGEWWSKDNGPLLGYMNDDSRPVALIPLSPKKYQLHDPANDTAIVVNVEVAKDIKPLAYTFYPSLPGKKLDMWNVFIDSAKSLWLRDIFMVILMGLAGGILSLLIPIATGLIFDKILPQGLRSELFYIASFLIAGAISRLMFQMVQSSALRRVQGRMDHQIQAAMWNKILDLPVSFFRKFTIGELAMKTMNIETIREILSGTTINSIFYAVFSASGVLLLFYYNKNMAVKVMLLIVFALGAAILFSKLRIGYNRRETEMGNKLNGMVFQIIMGISKFKVSGSEKRAFSLWAKEFSKLRRIVYKSGMLSNFFLVFCDGFPLIASLILFYWVSRSQNKMSIGIFIAFNAAFTNILFAVLSLANAFIKASNLIPILESASPIFEALPEYYRANEYPGNLSGDIEISHISFRYQPGAPLTLDDISLHIHPGEYVAIVGASGSGKSTLLRILLGFEKPEIGKIYYDGQDLGELDMRQVRKQLGVVLQNSSLMSGDIYSNIVGPYTHLTVDDAWEAARKAGIEDDVKRMPMGMYTIVSEGGSTLSGGQKQRILIARAIAGNPKILYFDEATSALDNQTQAVVSESLDQLNVTRVVIAHRLSTIANCERIIVLDKGKIVEEGSYEELMSKKGIFSQIAGLQLV